MLFHQEGPPVFPNKKEWEFSNSQGNLGNGQIFEDNDSSINNVVEKRVKAVTFADVGENEPCHDTPMLAVENGSERIIELRKRIDELRMELSSEKSLRKRKDKNLIKLAKELNRRMTESNETDRKVNDMVNFIHDLETKVQHKCHERNDEELHACYRTQRENEIRIAELDSSISTLRQELFHSKLEEDKLRAKLAANIIVRVNKSRSTMIHEGPQNSVSHCGNGLKVQLRRYVLSNIIVIILSLTVANLPLRVRDLLSLDALCSPIIPGNELRQGTFDAPWWAPASWKVAMFRTVCGNRRRSRITLQSNRLRLSEISDDSNESKRLWHGKAPHGVVVGSNSIDIKKTTKSTIRIDAPWSSLKSTHGH